MKKTFLMLVLACGLMLTGCAQLTNLTEKQSDVIAEYMAGSVLRYSDNYMESLVYPDESTDNATDKNSTPDKSAGTAADTNQNGNNKSDNTTDVNVSAKGNGTGSTAENNSGLSVQEFYKVLSDNDYKVEYTGYKLYDSYAQKDNYFTLRPTDGRKLLVVNFKVSNETKKTIKMNLGKIHIDYQLHLSDEKTYAPMVTLLDTDLNYIKYTLASGKSEDAVLIFDVPDNIKSEVLTLSISLNGQNTAISLNE